MIKKPKFKEMKLADLKDGDQFLYSRKSQVKGHDIEWVFAFVEIFKGGTRIYEITGAVGEPEDYPEKVLKIY